MRRQVSSEVIVKAHEKGEEQNTVHLPGRVKVATGSLLQSKFQTHRKAGHLARLLFIRNTNIMKQQSSSWSASQKGISY